MFFFTDQLTQLQRQAVENLTLRCKKIDGNSIPVYGEILLQRRNAKSNILWYEGKTLIGFCSIFFFKKHTCEISLLVAPKYRRQKKALEMFKAISSIINHDNIQEILFSCPQGAGNTWLPKHAMYYKGSEYQMIRDSRAALKTTEHTFDFRLAHAADIDIICAIDGDCFSSNTEDMRAHFLSRLSQPHYLIFLMYDGEHPIGKAHLNQQSDTVYLSDVCVIPERQRQGIGKILMTHCINMMLRKGRTTITLNVETNNDQALHLYRHLGFTLKNAHDYWVMSVDKIQNYTLS